MLKPDIIFCQLPYLAVVVGATAFILTALKFVLSFPVFLKVISSWHAGSPWLLLSFFFTNIITQSCWLTYLWSLNNYFIQIGLVLEILSATVFFLQTLRILLKH